MGRAAQPSYSLIDSQSVKTTDKAIDRGIDSGKKLKGENAIHIVTDTEGHILHRKAHAANTHDTVSGYNVFKEALEKYPTLLEWEFVDGSSVKAHQHSTSAASSDDEAIGKSVAGNTIKIHMAADADGLPIDFIITGGEVHDCNVAHGYVASCIFIHHIECCMGFGIGF